MEATDQEERHKTDRTKMSLFQSRAGALKKGLRKNSLYSRV